MMSAYFVGSSHRQSHELRHLPRLRQTLRASDRLWLACLALFAGLGCAPDLYQDCLIPCSKDNQSCPTDYVCNDQQVACVKKEHPSLTCPTGSGGSSGVGGESSKSETGGSTGTSGTQSQLGGSSGTSETTSSAGTTSDGGAAQTSSGGSAGFSSSGTATAGSSFGLGGATTTSTTSAGTGGITDGGSSGVVAVGGATSGGTTSSSTVGASGGTTSGGTSGTTGGTTTITCDGANAVTVTSTSLTGCLGEVYATPLTATGGSPADLDWTVDFPTGLALSAVKTNSGDTQLQGNLASAGNFTVYASARNSKTGCTSARTAVALTVGGAGVLGCPVISSSDAAAYLSTATPACRGLDYSTSFSVANGTAPYTWSSISLPAGLSFNPTSRSVSGIPTAAGTIVLQVSDSGTPKRVIQQSFSVALRDKCWLAYLLPGTSGTSLYLFDPYLRSRVQPAASKTAGASVQDFQFSPDGSYLAYRFQDSTGKSHLVLSTAPAWTTEVVVDLGLGTSVNSYAWSANSKTLAIAYASPSGAMLGGVQIGTGTLALSMLREVAADTDPGSPGITWYGGDGFVAFAAPNAILTGFTSVSYAKLGTLGFEIVDTSFEPYSSPMYFYPGTVGFFAGDTVSHLPYYYLVGDLVATPHGNDAIAPSGAFTAFASSDTLKLFRAVDTSDLHTEVPWASAAGCTSILTWAREKERLLCVDQAATALRMFTLSSTGPTIASATLGNSASFLQSRWNGNSRALSPSGERLALASSAGISIGLTNSLSPSLTRVADLQVGTSATEMAFTPDEQTLGIQVGTRVFILDMTGTVSATQQLGSVTTDAVSCQEDNLSWPSWCGRLRETASYQWSADSQAMAIAQSDGGLVVWDLRFWRGASLTRSVLVSNGCNGNCIGSFKFQP